MGIAKCCNFEIKKKDITDRNLLKSNIDLLSKMISLSFENTLQTIDMESQKESNLFPIANNKINKHQFFQKHSENINKMTIKTRNEIFRNPKLFDNEDKLI